MAPTSASRAAASFVLPPASQPLALITGDAGDNVLTGTLAGDTINGLGGNDRIEGRDGVDRLNGGEGNDVINDFLDNIVDGGGGDDLIVNAFVSGGTWVGGTGVDTIDFSNDAFDGIINLAAASFLILGARFSGFENAIGSQGSERINGTSGDNFIDGQSGDDLLTGGNGYDTIDGGAGNDRITDGGANVVNGGEGDDVIKNTNVSGGIWSGGNGTDKIDFTGNDFGAITIDLNTTSFVINGAAFRGFEGVTGSAGNERILGTAGANWLSGGTGIDTLIGGLGNDTYVIDSSRDQIVETADGGIDTVQTSVSLTLKENLEHITLLGTGNIDGNGNALANIVIGNAGNNVLRGYDGNDTLIGGDGNDTLAGGAGNNSMTGGAGDDFYHLSSGLFSYQYSILEQANGGIDTIVVSVLTSFDIPQNVENMRMLDARTIRAGGNALDNIITVAGAGSTIDGLAGNDTLYGSAGNDRMEGGAGNDRMEGGAGNDTLTGGAGSDVMVGGAGNDLYRSDVSTDQFIEVASKRHRHSRVISVFNTRREHRECSPAAGKPHRDRKQSVQSTVRPTGIEADRAWRQ